MQLSTVLLCSLMSYQLVSPRAVTDFAASYPSWSPDGTRIAFQSNRDGDDLEIYVIELRGGRLTQLTDNDFDDLQPAWSPDGASLVFVSRRDANTEIYRMHADGSMQERLTHYPQQDLHPTFSQRVGRILFNREKGEGRDSTAEIYEMNADGADVEQLTENRFPYTYPSWSPDGSQLLFVQWFPPTSRPGRPNTEISLLARGAKEPTRLTKEPGFDGYPAWSPDGERIAFTSDRLGGRNQLFLMQRDGTAVVALTEQGDVAFARPSWSPDGTKIVCTGDSGQSERLYIIEVPSEP